MLVPAVGAAALILGFAVAQGTGQRWLGGIVVLAVGAWCAWQWYRMAGLVRAVVAVAIFGVAFVVSHPLGKALGAWPAVLVVSAVAAVCCGVLAAPRRAGTASGRA